MVDLLPDLVVEISAEMVNNNFPDFKKQFKAKLQDFKYELLNDDDFGKAKTDITTLKNVEASIRDSVDKIVNGSTDIKKAVDSMLELAEEARTIRLSREKEVKAENAKKIKEITEDAISKIERDSITPEMAKRISDSMKSRRTFDKKQLASLVESIKINGELKESRQLIKSFKDSHGDHIAPDESTLETLTLKEINAELKKRVEKSKDIELPSTPNEAYPKTPQAQVKDEWSEFLELIPRAFAPIREKRLSFEDERNKKRAKEFADKISALYKGLLTN